MSKLDTFFNSTLGKAVKTALYLGASAGLGYLLTIITNSPQLLGVYAPIVNIVLVAAKNFADKSVPNLPAAQ